MNKRKHGRSAHSQIFLSQKEASEMKPQAWILRVYAAAGLLAATYGVPALPKTAHAAHGSWTQTAWTTPSSTLYAVGSGSNVFSSGGTAGVCAGSGPWCDGGGNTLRLSGNWATDSGNPYSSDLNADDISEVLLASWHNGSTQLFNGGRIQWGQSGPNWSTGNAILLPMLGVLGIAVALRCVCFG